MHKSVGLRFLAAVILLAVCLPATAATFTVTSVNDAGPGTLRQAIIDANAARGGTIAFAIGSGFQTIKLKSTLPTAELTVIDGRTQPGYTNKPLIELDGSLISPAGNALQLDNSAAYALIVNRAPNVGISIRNSRVWNCYVGTDASGTAARPNDYGVSGVGEVTKSLISGNRTANLAIARMAAENLIGTDATGEAVLLPSPTHGNVFIYGASEPVILKHNVIGGGTGIYIFSVSPNVVITENLIGVSRTGTPLPNYNGIRVFMSPGKTIEANSIAYSTGAAIAVSDRESLRVRILNNRIYGNAFGIDLAASGGLATPNDLDDSDVGPNNLTNYPVITRAAADATGTTITGTLNSHPNTTFLIELFVTPTCNSSGHGEGKTRVLRFEETTNAAGVATFSKRVGILPGGHAVTATATSDDEGTSEFSRCVAVEGPGTFRFQTASAAVDEKAGKIALTIQRQLGAVGPATVHYATSGTSATAGSDYTTTSGTLAFADGEWSKTITIPIIDDAVFEGDETFTATLSNATGATLGTPATVVVTITDDEPAPTLTVADVRGDEGDSGTTPFTFALQLSRSADVPLTFQYQTADYEAAAGTDYTAASGTVVFAPGERTKNVVVQVHGDTNYEGSESFRFSFLRNGIFAAQAVGTIGNDDDPPHVSVTTVSLPETDTRTTVSITLTASQPITGTLFYVTRSKTAIAGEDFLAVSGYADFYKSDTATIQLQLEGDDVLEDTEYFDLDLYTYGGFSVDRRVSIAIEDDDIGVGPVKLSVPSGESRRGLIQIGSPAAVDTTFNIVSSGPDAVQAPATVILPAGQTRVTFDVRALVPGRREELTVTIPPAFGGGTGTIRVATYTIAELTLTPAELTLYPGQVVTVHASFSQHGSEVSIPLSSDGTVEVPERLVIDPNGHGSFTVKALKNGPLVITAALPSEFGGEQIRVVGRVADPPAFPTLTSISPNNGSVAGGTRVDVRGALFRTDCTLSFGGVPATMLQYVDASTFVAVAPPSAAGPVDLTLRCGDDVTSLPRAFTYRSATPQLAAITPASGNTAGGTYVRITGYDFASSCWPFFGEAASPEAVVHDAQTMTAVVPPHAAGTVDVRLLCTGYDALLTGAFSYTTAADPAAQIVDISPFFGAPGDTVTIAGHGFRPDDVVAFEGVTARILASTPESHTVVVPNLAPGRANVTIGAGSTVLAATGPVFTVGESAPPRVTRVVPAAAAAGAEIALEGTQLRAPYTFAIDGVAMPLVSLLPARAIVRIPPGLAAGTYPIAVMNGSNQIASLGPAINVRSEGIVLDRVIANCGATDGGIDVVITGSGFIAGATVTFDDVRATSVVVVDTNTIRARVPANYAGDTLIAVKNANGDGSTLTGAFRYVSPFDPAGCSVRRTRSVRH